MAFAANYFFTFNLYEDISAEVRPRLKLQITIDNEQKKYMVFKCSISIYLHKDTNLHYTGSIICSETLYLLIVSQLIDKGIFFRFKWKIHSKASKWHQPCFNTMSNIEVRWHISQQKKHSIRRWSYLMKTGMMWKFWKVGINFFLLKMSHYD